MQRSEGDGSVLRVDEGSPNPTSQHPCAELGGGAI